MANDQLPDILKSRGLKVTPQRLAVLSALMASDTHPATDEIYREVRLSFPNISIDTVNRTLKTLSDVGLAEVVEGLGNQRRFDAKQEPHHHIHCVGCGKIIDFENSALDDIDIPAEIRQKYNVIGKRFVITVLCDTCGKKEK